MLISNYWTSFHLWSKETLVKHQKVSKYLETNPLQTSFACFLLTAKLIKTRYIYARIYFIFLKNVLKQT